MRASSGGAAPTESRALALAEVTAAFALAHVAFRAFRAFTDLGRREVEAGLAISPGVILALAGVLFVAARGRRLADHGITPRGALRGIDAGLVALAALAGAGGILLACGIVPRPMQCGPREGIAGAAAGVAATLALATWMDRPVAALERLPAALRVGLVLAIPAAVLALGLARGASVSALAPAIAGRLVCAGFAEELFFRGYVQTRLDQAFGTPWRFAGVSFGAGLIGAAVLYAFVHALNPVNYFSGRWQWDGWHALVTLAMPFGFLRAKYGSIVPGAVAHALTDVLAVAAPGYRG
jgi:membrane protease YdiL (CAAX protease family)